MLGSGFAALGTMNLSYTLTLILLAGLATTLMDALQSNYPPTFLSLLSPLAFLLMLTLQYAWLSWPQLVPETEPENAETWGELVGDPQFHTEKGIYATVMIGTELTKVVLQPKWWPYFSSELLRSEKEAAVSSSPVTQLPMGQEPSYLVSIQSRDGVVRGMGCRARIGNEVVLLTSYHVTQCSDELFITKFNPNEQVGKRFKIEDDWQTNFYCSDKDVDVIAINVPAKIWATLCVGTIKAKVPTVRKIPCQLFGAESSSKIKCSAGMAWLATGFTGRHTATTTKSWSGSPVVSNGYVIGVHRGTNKQVIDQNTFTVMHPSFFPQESESDWDQGHIMEIDAEEIGSRDEKFTEVYIAGRGIVTYGDSEYVSTKQRELNMSEMEKNFKSFTWAEAVDDDLDYETILGSKWADAEGVFPGEEEQINPPSGIPLNYQGAESACSSPSNSSANTAIPVCVPLETVACPSLQLDSRVLVLEKLLEPLLAEMTLMRESIFQNSRTLTGLSVALERNLIPCSSKPVDSGKLKDPVVSKEPLKNSVGNTHELPNVIASEVNGIPMNLNRKSRRSRKGKLKPTPLQESPSPA